MREPLCISSDFCKSVENTHKNNLAREKLTSSEKKSRTQRFARWWWWEQHGWSENKNWFAVCDLFVWYGTNVNGPTKKNNKKSYEKNYSVCVKLWHTHRYEYSETSAAGKKWQVHEMHETRKSNKRDRAKKKTLINNNADSVHIDTAQKRCVYVLAFEQFLLFKNA